MKCPAVYGLAIVLPILLTGCAGYNNTMFMTKSNIGLDFDSKPPTAEINISRKEAVIAPAFEGAKTPPVMASFKPSVKAGGSFTSFFMGVDQTFAGGDAAFAMAKLYDKPTASDKEDYDSSLQLTRAPEYKNWFQSIPGPGKSRPLIFGTDTSLGLKVAWSGAGGQIPDTVKLGFNRKEFAWAPLSVTPATVPVRADQAGRPIANAVAIKMPAFLATVESKQAVGGQRTNGIKVEAMQYFATGDSATYLAMQRVVREAMLARLDPNSRAFQSRFSAGGLDVFSDILFSVQAILSHWAAHDDKVAAAFLDKLNNLPNLELPDKYRNDRVPEYVFNPSTMVLQKNAGTELTLGRTFNQIIGYLSFLESSQQNLTNALSQIAAKKAVKLQIGPEPAPQNEVTAAMVQPLTSDLGKLKQEAERLKRALASNPAMQAADFYVTHKSSNQ
jgi:hypothetical protein